MPQEGNTVVDSLIQLLVSSLGISVACEMRSDNVDRQTTSDKDVPISLRTATEKAALLPAARAVLKLKTLEIVVPLAGMIW